MTGDGDDVCKEWELISDENHTFEEGDLLVNARSNMESFAPVRSFNFDGTSL
jgi:hypothetical protein